jgi:hypothetical protein
MRMAIAFQRNDRVPNRFILRVANRSFDDRAIIVGLGLAAACREEQRNQRQKDA